MGRKKRYKYGVQEISLAAALKESKVVRDINSGKLKYEDLREVAEYVVTGRNLYVGEMLKAARKEERGEEPF